MAITVVGYASAAGAATTLTVNKSAVEASLGGTVTNGDLLIAVIASDWGRLPTTQSGWTDIPDLFATTGNGSSSSDTTIKGYSRTASSEPSSWTFDTTVNNTPDAVLTIIALRGATMSGAVADAAITDRNGVAAFDTPSLSGTGGILLAGSACEDSGGATLSYTPPSGMTEIADAQSTFWMTSSVAYLLGPPNPTVARTFTLSQNLTSSRSCDWALLIPALTFRGLVDNLSTSSFGTGTATTGSFTPTSGRRLVAITGGQEDNGNTDPSGSFTVSDSQGLTWTKIGDVGNGGNWSHGIAAWISTPAAATSTTVSFDCGARNIYRYFYNVFEVDSSNGSIAGYVEDDASTNDGAYSVTLTTAPAANDLSVFCRILDTGTTTLSMGAGWTKIGDQSDSSGGGSFAVAVRDASTSTTVSITDTNVAGASTAKSTDFAFIIKATGSAVAVAGDATGAAGATGTLARDRGVSGQAEGSSDLDGTLSRDRAVSGQATGAADLDGSFDLARALTGSGPGSSGLSGVLGVDRGVSGDITGAGSLDGVLDLGHGLSGLASGSGGAAGSLARSRTLSAAASGSNSLTGVLTVTDGTPIPLPLRAGTAEASSHYRAGAATTTARLRAGTATFSS